MATSINPPSEPVAFVEPRGSYDALTDGALLALVAQASEQAILTLFDRYSRVIFCVALRVLHDRGAAEDIVQEVFLKIWSNPLRFEVNRGSLGAWLSVIARHRSIDLLRRRAPCDSIDDLVLSSPGNLAADCEQHLLIEKMRGLMVELPPEQQQALDLAFFHGLSHSEIAALTGVPLGTVKTRIRRALLRLKKAVEA